MPISLVKANIIILATVHNPSILSPDWLKKNGMIDEKPIDYVNSLGFSMVELKSQIFNLDQHRFLIDSKVFDEKTLRSLKLISSKYVSLLPHIPYNSLGQNFVWRFEPDNGNNIPKIGININTVDDLQTLFQNDSLAFGTIMKINYDSYILNFKIEPTDAPHFEVHFNYHYNLEKRTNENIIQILNDHENHFNLSKNIAENICLK